MKRRELFKAILGAAAGLGLLRSKTAAAAPARAAVVPVAHHDASVGRFLVFRARHIEPGDLAAVHAADDGGDRCWVERAAGADEVIGVCYTLNRDQGTAVILRGGAYSTVRSSSN